MDKLRLWVAATRPPSLLTSLLPCLAGGLVAVDSSEATWSLLAVALVAMLFLHAGVNASNDVEDAARGVDEATKTRNSGVFNTGQLSTREGRRFYALLFSVAAGLGIVICVLQSPVLLIIGLVGLLGGLLYTAGPRPYKYLGLGEPAIVLLMGPLITQGSYTAVTGDGFAAGAFWAGLGPGLLIAAVLAANNLEDVAGDGAAGLRTIAVRVGFGRFRWIYVAILAGVIPAELALWIAGLFNAWILLPFLVLPLMVGLVRAVAASASPADPGLDGLTGRTAQMHILFSVLLCVAVVLART